MWNRLHGLLAETTKKMLEVQAKKIFLLKILLFWLCWEQPCIFHSHLESNGFESLNTFSVASAHLNLFKNGVFIFQHNSNIYFFQQMLITYNFHLVKHFYFVSAKSSQIQDFKCSRESWMVLTVQIFLCCSNKSLNGALLQQKQNPH